MKCRSVKISISSVFIVSTLLVIQSSCLLDRFFKLPQFSKNFNYFDHENNDSVLNKYLRIFDKKKSHV